MDKALRIFQLEALGAFKKVRSSFALAGGTALELCYLQHRFSLDLDFFSRAYNKKEIASIIAAFKSMPSVKVRFENEVKLPLSASAEFYTLSKKGLKRPLKVDFVQDNLIKSPKVVKFKGVPVYSVKDIYSQKIFAVSGTSSSYDETGKSVFDGRKESRDIFDIYFLSKKIMPLSKFMVKMPKYAQRGFIHWHHTFSRHDLKIALLDLDIYKENFNAQEMLLYLQGEARKFIKNISI